MKYIQTILLAISLVLIIGCSATVEDDSITVTDVDDVENTTTEVEDTTTEEEEDVEDTDDTTEEDDSDSIVEAIEDNSESVEVIEIEDLKFKPKTMTIDAGTKVKWVHNDKFADSDVIKHIIRLYKVGETLNVQSDGLFYGDTFEYVFDEPGTYRYISIVYAPRGAEGDIIVE